MLQRIRRTLGVPAVLVVSLFTLCVVAAARPGAADAAPTFVHAASPDLPEMARGVPMGGALWVFDLELDQARPTDLELTRFAVFAPDAAITVVDGPAAAVPDVAYFRGRTSDDTNAVVMLAVPQRGKAHGVVIQSSGTWMLESRVSGRGLATRRVDTTTEFAGRSFECQLDGWQASTGPVAPSAGATTSGLPGSGIPLAVKYTAHIIVDTDVEYWEKFWNLPGNTGNPSKTAAEAIAYLGDLFAYASTVYEREVDTNLLIQSARLFAGAADTDPYEENDDFCGCTGYGKLDEVQDEWSGDSTPRTLVHFISGKTEGCGCAYIGVLCSQGDGYGASSGIGTNFDIDNPGFVWEGMVLAHELGHNFDAQHTHDFCGEDGIADPVDICVDDATDDVANCLGDNNRSLPGLGSLTGGTAGDQNGTIMSYCHIQSGGFANIAHSFGLYHPYGRAAYRVPNKMLAHVQDSAGCMGLDYTGSDLRVVKDCKPDDPMPVGATATCTITVENLGPDVAQGALTVDEFLSDGTFTFGTIVVTKGGVAMPAGTCAATANPQDGAGTVTCNLDVIDAGHKAVIQIPVSGGEPQNINDRVVVSSDSPDPDQTNNVAEDEVNIVAANADLVVTKLCKPDSGPWYAGQPDPPFCEILVTNLGPQTAEGVAMVDRVVGSGQYEIAAVTTDPAFSDNCSTVPGIGASTTSSTVSCSLLDPLPSGGKWKVRVTYDADDPVDINDEATVTAATSDADSANNTATGSVQVAGAADLSITKSDSPDPVTAGSALTYTIQVTNDGPSTAGNVVVTDLVPAGVAIQSVTSSVGSCQPGEAGNAAKPTTCALGSLADGAVATITIVVNVLPGTRGVLLNAATVSSATFDPDGSDNTASEETTVEAEAALQVTKADSPDPVAAGAQLFYTITVTNGGPSTATDVQLTDTLPQDVSYVTAVDGNGQGVCALNPGNLVVCDLGDLEPGESTQVFLTVQVAPSVPDGTILTNTVVVTAAEDPDGAEASSMTTVITRADVWIDKKQESTTGNPSGTIIYTLTAYNRPGCEEDDQLTCWNQAGGPSDAQDVVVTDALPLTSKKWVVQFVSPGCVYDEPSHTVTCMAGTVAFGQSATFRIESVVKGSNGTVQNTATVQSSTADPVAANNTDTVTTTIQGGTGKTGGKGGH